MLPFKFDMLRGPRGIFPACVIWPYILSLGDGSRALVLPSAPSSSLFETALDASPARVSRYCSVFYKRELLRNFHISHNIIIK